MTTEGIPTPSPSFIDNMNTKVEKGLKLDLPITYGELEALCAGDDFCERALEQFKNYAIRYSNDVWKMNEALKNRAIYTDEEWREIFPQMDNERTRLHNTLIDSIKILSRKLNDAERDNSWMRALAPAGQVERATCGKFAIMLTYSMYVK